MLKFLFEIVSINIWGCLNLDIWKLSQCTHALLSVDTAMQQLGALSLLLRFDKYNFKRSSQTALAGRLHNEHNNPPPPGSSSSSFTLAERHVCMCTCLCFTASLSEAPHLLRYTKRMYRETFWTSFLQGKCISLPLLPSICPSHVMPDWPQHPYKRSKGRQNSLVSWQPVCHQPE